MFSFFKKSNPKQTSSGCFSYIDGQFAEIKNYKNMSTNDVSNFLGYRPDTVFPYFYNFDENADYKEFIFKVFTKEIVFILTNENISNPDKKKIDNIIKSLSFEDIYDSYTIEGILEDGIENGTLTIDVLHKNLNLSDKTNNGILFSEKLGLNLIFHNGILEDFQSASGLNKWAKNWININSSMVDSYEREALNYWGEQQKSNIINEINSQADAWANLPNPSDNPYLEQHRSKFGNISYYNILVCHHGAKVNKVDFLKVNHGRYKIYKDADSENMYQIGEFVVEFNSEDIFIRSFQIIG